MYLCGHLGLVQVGFWGCRILADSNLRLLTGLVLEVRKMRTVKVIAFLGILLVAAFQTAWAGPQDFLLFNRTGVDIYGVYVAPSDSEEWGDDLMEGEVLQNGGDIEIVFAPDEDIALWDVMVEDQDGNALYWRHVNLMKAAEIILEPDEVARIKEI